MRFFVAGRSGTEAGHGDAAEEVEGAVARTKHEQVVQGLPAGGHDGPTQGTLSTACNSAAWGLL